MHEEPQDQRPEDTTISPLSEQLLPLHNRMPTTPFPAPSEQFLFPELSQQDTLEAPMQLSAQDTNSPPTLPVMPLPEQPLWATPPSLTEYSSYHNTQPLPPPVYMAPPLPASPASVAPSPQSSKRTRAVTLVISLILIILLILLSGVGLIYDFAYYQPQQARLAATAQANAQATSTVNAAGTAIGNLDASVTAQSQATAQALQALYQQATSGTPVLNDPLSQQSGNQWDEGAFSDKSACLFKNGSYHVIQPNAGFFLQCEETTRGFADFAFQVDMTIISGDRGGVLFRSNDNTGKTYVLDLDSFGNYALYVYTGYSASLSRRLIFGQAPAQLVGPSQITIIAQGSTLYFYLNKQFVDMTTDATLRTGLVGVLADDVQQATEVAYSNAKVWIL